MKIKQVSEQLNMSPRAIRFYEEQGLLTPAKNDATGYRRFTEHDIQRLQMVAILRELGLTIEEIRRCLQEVDRSGTTSSLHRHIERQRAALAVRQPQYEHLLTTADRMLYGLNQEMDTSLERLYNLALEARKRKEQLTGWSDSWNFDERAPQHDFVVRANSGEYADYEEALDAIADWLAPVPGERGLDIGTGTGNLAEKLAARGARMAGVDQSSGMLKLSRTKLPGMDAKLGNALALPFRAGEFDFVASSFALRYLSEEQLPIAIGEMRRVLKPHGRICIADTTAPLENDLAMEAAGAKVEKVVAGSDSDNSSDAKAGSDPANVSELFLRADLLRVWLDRAGFLTGSGQLNARLTLIYAVPILKGNG